MDQKNALPLTLRTAYYQAFREARANGRIGYQVLNSQGPSSTTGPRAAAFAWQLLTHTW